MRGDFSHEMGGASRRNVFPGIQGLKQTTYSVQENNVLVIPQEVKTLLEDLENRVDEKDEKSPQ